MLTKESIQSLLKTNDKAVARALLVLNKNQTADEQASKDTRYRNGKGFRPCHARMGTSMATFYQRKAYLTPKQIAYWRALDRTGNMRIGIYWQQLIDAANEKNAVSATVEVVAGPDVGSMVEDLMRLKELLGEYTEAGDYAKVMHTQDRIDMVNKEIARAHMIYAMQNEG